MQRNQVEEFYRELDATCEDFVRQKFATNGYAGWKVKHVKQWLDRRSEAAKTKREESVRFWTMVVGVTGVLALFVTGVGEFLKG
jgi:preprotein translocase subunit SecE